ncbi:MAG: type II toxin-antitoxin system RelE/ParE family toxin [Bacteroidetes bacterium]|nr:type II toxin-antitoxin system RelE/ParE family toxin [Bacteroidota bacterium]MBS1632931.1 type II toxin-antitoxin system RelE/ParE family toxin [Bacteroidota bacterium]
MNFKIVPTPFFEKELKHLAKKYPSLVMDFRELTDKLQKEPRIGTPLGNECYKIRLAIRSKGQGKSGGARVITHVWVSETTVFLLSIYDKSEAETISDKDLKERLKYLKHR